MLGWEFPPFIAGGLGTAVDGLTKSLVAQGHEVVFVLPQPLPEGHQSHVELIGPGVLAERSAQLRANRAQPVVHHHQSASTTTSTTTTVTTRTVGQVGSTPTIQDRVETFQASMPSSYPGVDAHDVLRRVVAMVGGARGD